MHGWHGIRAVNLGRKPTGAHIPRHPSPDHGRTDRQLGGQTPSSEKKTSQFVSRSPGSLNFAIPRMFSSNRRLVIPDYNYPGVEGPGSEATVSARRDYLNEQHMFPFLV